MNKLTPAARAVLNAIHEIMPDTSIAEVLAIAAALRTAALYTKRDRLILLSIADELEQLDD